MTLRKFVLGDLVSWLRLTQFTNNVCPHFIHRHLITRTVMHPMCNAIYKYIKTRKLVVYKSYMEVSNETSDNVA